MYFPDFPLCKKGVNPGFLKIFRIGILLDGSGPHAASFIKKP